jgi:hypothetical protein
VVASTGRVCFIRTLLGDHTMKVRRAVHEELDDEGEPVDFAYLNTWGRDYVMEFVRKLGWWVELIEDEYDPAVLEREHGTLKRGRNTRMVGGKQADGAVILNWEWLKITRPRPSGALG